MKRISPNRYILDVDDILKIFKVSVSSVNDKTEVVTGIKLNPFGEPAENIRLIHRNIHMVIHPDVDEEIINLIKIRPHLSSGNDLGIYHISTFYVSKSIEVSAYTLYGFDNFRDYIESHVFFELEDIYPDKIGIIIELDDEKASYFKMKYL